MKPSQFYRMTWENRKLEELSRQQQSRGAYTGVLGTVVLTILIEVALKSSGNSLTEGDSWLLRDKRGEQVLRELVG